MGVFLLIDESAQVKGFRCVRVDVGVQTGC
jgi:hypothetical protein